VREEVAQIMYMHVSKCKNSKKTVKKKQNKNTEAMSYRVF
jgi:hypothetical protein